MRQCNEEPEKANLLDPHSIKHVLDESVMEERPSTPWISPPLYSIDLLGFWPAIPRVFDDLLTGCDRQGIPGGREAKQLAAAVRRGDHRHRACRPILSEEVPGEPGFPHRLHRIISLIVVLC